MKSVKVNKRSGNLRRLAALVAGMVMLLALPFTIKAQYIPEPPNPPRLVNDFAHLMSDAEVQKLEKKLVAYNDSTTTQIVIVTIETLDGAEVGSFGAELGEKWGVGTKKNHNGIVILVAKAEHKMTIRTGYGVEEKLGSVTVQHIIDDRLKPTFRHNDYYQGFDEATNEIIARLSGMYVDDTPKDVKGIPIWVITLIILITFTVLLIIFRNGGGKGGTYSRGGYTGPTYWGGGFGGWSSGGGGGGWSSGGGSSGGFGGFGGGGFSGGGASGSW